jgi:hypothetical protein
VLNRSPQPERGHEGVCTTPRLVCHRSAQRVRPAAVFDRLPFRGTLRRLANAAGLASFLSYAGVLLKDFGGHSRAQTERVEGASPAVAEAAGPPVRYLADP